MTKSSDCSTPTGTVTTALSAVNGAVVGRHGRRRRPTIRTRVDDVREADVEPLREVRREAVVAVGEHHLVAVDRIVVETVRGEVLDPRAVLLLRPMLQVLAHALRAVLVPALAGDRLFGDVAVGGIRSRCRDDLAEAWRRRRGCRR